MRTYSIAALAAAAGLSFAASQAQATVFTLDSFTVTANSSDPGLIVQIAPIQTTPLTFDLGLDDPQTFSLFKIYTTEDWVNNGEDTTPKPISVSFNFSAPVPNSVDPVTGQTYGELKIGGLFQNGQLTWDNGGVTQFHYGNDLSGLMTITLNGGEFNSGILGLNDGNHHHGADYYGLKVKATFDWDNDPTGAVPEPATWALMIGGFGMAGATLRRRRALVA